MENDDHYEMAKRAAEFRKLREEKIKDVSKTRLLKIAKKKVQTTMIGALSAIEKHLSFLLQENDERLNNIFDELRSDILDKGNTQIRNLENEFNNYEVVWKKNTIFLPFKGDK
jgi:hypothetical protein